MKKFFGTMAVAAALFAGYSAFEVQNTNTLSNVALANVEALANDENLLACHYINGVTNIQLESSFWHRTEHLYYDCCAVQYKGYDYDKRCQ